MRGKQVYGNSRVIAKNLRRVLQISFVDACIDIEKQMGGESESMREAVTDREQGGNILTCSSF